MRTIRKLSVSGLLSFAPDSSPFDLQALNVLIGPNGSGKSNFIEVLELLSAAPHNLAAAVRDGGLPNEWLWRGNGPPNHAEVDVQLGENTPTGRPLRYRLRFAPVQNRLEIVDEAIEELEPQPGEEDVYFYYRFQEGHPVLNVKDNHGSSIRRQLKREDLTPDQSVLSQRKDPEQYPEVTWTGHRLGAIRTFREWTFGRYARLRRPQPPDLPDDQLLPDSSNLALVVNRLEHSDETRTRINSLLRQFFPRFERFSTLVSGGAVQFFLHETNFDPIPATRISDGTLRFIAILATLLSPSPPALVCMEEPELGLHPDAVALLADVLVEASERMQLVVTTHSDALVSALTNHPDAIVACERPGAASMLRRLDPAQLASWLEEYRLGDLWRMGDLGANP
ncbi:MAG: AAA family ATPase [Spirochaetaceae bacterium]|nr:AAA family ATPase [Spirochaetaceae bacterium]